MEQNNTNQNTDKLVVTCGSFDGLPHPGHIEMLKTCGRLGRLVVVLAHDDAIRRNKSREPKYAQSIRSDNLMKTGLVEKVIQLTGDAVQDLQIILDLRPDVYCFGEDQLDGLALDINEQLSQTDCEVKRIPRYMPEQYSTTALYFSDPLL